MSKFKITVARIEVDARGKQDAQVRITFRIDRPPISFQVPILLSIRDFDDTEMVQAARSALHRTFVELAAQSQKWKLTSKDLRQLSVGDSAFLAGIIRAPNYYSSADRRPERGAQSRDRLPENPPGDEKKCRAVDESGENFPAQISVRFFRCAWLPAEPGDEQRQPECGDVSEHVTGIGQQRN